MTDQSDPFAAVREAQLLTLRGLLGDAESVVQGIRERYRVETDALLTSRLMIAEGCIAAYRGAWSEARDRLTRARLIAGGGGLPEVELTAEAWLSFVEFNDGRLDQALSFAAHVIKDWRKAESYALFRSGSVLCFLCYLSGLVSRAERWQSFSKRMAELAGDSSATSALIFDAAAMRLAAMRFDVEIGGRKGFDFAREVVFCRSARNFDSMAQVRVMNSLHLLLEGQSMSLAGEHRDACSLLSRFLHEGEGLPKISLAQGVIELIWAKSKFNPAEISASEIQSANAAFGDLLEDDDIAVYGARMAGVCELLGMSAQAREYSDASRRAAGRFSEWKNMFQMRLGDTFREIGLEDENSIAELMTEISANLRLN